MEPSGGMAGYADLALGFVGGINSIGPLIPAFAPEIKMGVRIVLEDTGREAFIDLGARPPKVSYGKVDRPADIILSAKAIDFHDILRGKLNLIKAMNEKRILLEFLPTAFANLPERIPATSDTPTQIPGFVYEMYLVSIGASHILEGATAPNGMVRLEPGKKGFFAGFSGVVAWIFGVFFGVFLGIFKLLKRKPDPDKPPEIEWHELDKIPPPMTIELPKIIISVLNWFFSKVDMFKLADSFVGGARITGALKG